MEWFPDPVRENTLAGLFTLGTAATLALAALWALFGSRTMTVRWSVLTLVLAVFAALFWLEPLLERYA